MIAFYANITAWTLRTFDMQKNYFGSACDPCRVSSQAVRGRYTPSVGFLLRQI